MSSIGSNLNLGEIPCQDEPAGVRSPEIRGCHQAADQVRLFSRYPGQRAAFKREPHDAPVLQSGFPQKSGPNMSAGPERTKFARIAFMRGYVHLPSLVPLCSAMIKVPDD